MIKTISFLFICFFAGIQLYAQTPDAFQYQALVRNTSGAAMLNTNVTVSFKIHQKTATGSVVFAEWHQTATNASGIVNLQIGKGNAEVGRLGLVNWVDGPYFIETEVDYGSGAVNTGTQQLFSVPFAKYAENTGNVKLKSPNGKVWNISVSNQGEISTIEVTE